MIVQNTSGKNCVKRRLPKCLIILLLSPTILICYAILGRNGAASGRYRRMPRMEERRAVQYLILELLEVQIDHRSDIQSDELGYHQSADDDHTERPAGRPVGSVARGNGHGPEDGRQSRHDDGTETVQTA